MADLAYEGLNLEEPAEKLETLVAGCPDPCNPVAILAGYNPNTSTVNTAYGAYSSELIQSEAADVARRLNPARPKDEHRELVRRANEAYHLRSSTSIQSSTEILVNALTQPRL